MLIEFDHNPVDRNTKCYEMTIGPARLYFSYSTLIGLSAPGIGYKRRENIWGRTTGRHITEMGILAFDVVSKEELSNYLNQVIISSSARILENRLAGRVD